MARPRFPSDERRKKQRPHVKVHLSVRNHRKTVGHFDAPEFRGQWLGLMMIAGERFAGKEGGIVHLSTTDQKWISGKNWESSAQNSVKTLLKLLEYECSSVEDSPGTLRVRIPKFRDKQGYAPRSASDTPHNSADSVSLQRTKEPKNQRSIDKGKAPPSVAGMCLAEGLREKILGLMPNARVPKNLEAWARAYDLVLKRDGRSETDLLAQQAWLFGKNQSQEAKFVVLAPTKHGKRFDQICLAMQSDSPQPQRVSPAVAAARAEEERLQRERVRQIKERDRRRANDTDSNPKKLGDLIEGGF